ncbi:hypothetical protein QOZ80_4AG0310930 [Eleusine coracana subsp. coracana]|nr:hypothetical protein QOZ80_4AG0310930 [Eleusine coracana subsp. coracana]
MSNINEHTLSVISIVAKSGAGKATLVRLIYQDRRAFDKQMWIRMSDKFDARCLMIAILEQATQVQCDITDLHLLMEHVKAELTDKKFLLVLENCVLESQRFWSNALEYLNIGAKGSFIIITTPKETVSKCFKINELLLASFTRCALPPDFPAIYM